MTILPETFVMCPTVPNLPITHAAWKPLSGPGPSGPPGPCIAWSSRDLLAASLQCIGRPWALIAQVTSLSKDLRLLNTILWGGLLWDYFLGCHSSTRFGPRNNTGIEVNTATNSNLPSHPVSALPVSFVDHFKFKLTYFSPSFWPLAAWRLVPRSGSYAGIEPGTLRQCSWWHQ